jgi:hypothetical protein
MSWYLCSHLCRWVCTKDGKPCHETDDYAVIHWLSVNSANINIRINNAEKAFRRLSLSSKYALAHPITEILTILALRIDSMTQVFC